MKKIFIFSIMFLLSYGSLQSQEAPPRGGIGFEFREYFYFIFKYFGYVEQPWVDSIFPGENCHNIYIPIYLGKSYRLEPQLGFSYYSRYITYSSSSEKNTLYSFQLGIGFFHMPLRSQPTLYYGGRLGLIYSSETSKDINRVANHEYIDIDKESGFGFFFAPTIGGEYFVHRKISLGCEVQLKWLYINLEDEHNYKDDRKKYLTDTLFFTRFYF